MKVVIDNRIPYIKGILEEVADVQSADLMQITKDFRPVKKGMRKSCNKDIKRQTKSLKAESKTNIDQLLVDIESAHTNSDATGGTKPNTNAIRYIGFSAVTAG